jgi:hypothetical protein
MREILLWTLVIVGEAVCIYFIVRTFVFAHSLFRDVPYVPTGRSVARQALQMLGLEKRDRFVDIGSGDGYTVFQASEMLEGVGEFTGVEISKYLVLSSNFHRLFHKHKESIRFIRGNMFDQDYSGYNKIFLFLTTDLLKRMTPKLEKELPKGSKIVSILFKFPEEFSKKHRIESKSCKMWGKEWQLYLWSKE